MTWEATCASWWSKTSSGTNTVTDEGTYRCEYGGREVPLAECGVYRQTFDTRTEKPTVTDPVTGNQTDWSNTPDNANQYGTGAQSNQASDRCVLSFSLNPVDWVLRPLRCLFEPRKTKIDAAMTNMSAAWSASSAAGLVGAVGGLGAAFQGGTGCSGLPFHLEWNGHVLVHTRLLDACDEPMAGIAATVKGLLTVALILATLFALLRYVAALFGFAPFGSLRDDIPRSRRGDD